MRRYAELLALRHDSPRTRHSYYRAMRLVHEHFGADPATLGEDHFRDYLAINAQPLEKVKLAAV